MGTLTLLAIQENSGNGKLTSALWLHGKNSYSYTTLPGGFYCRCPSAPHSPGSTQGARFEAEFGAPIPACPPQHRYRHLLLGTGSSLFTLSSARFSPLLGSALSHPFTSLVALFSTTQNFSAVRNIKYKQELKIKSTSNCRHCHGALKLIVGSTERNIVTLSTIY